MDGNKTLREAVRALAVKRGIKSEAVRSERPLSD